MEYIRYNQKTCKKLRIKPGQILFDKSHLDLGIVMFVGIDKTLVEHLDKIVYSTSVYNRVELTDFQFVAFSFAEKKLKIYDISHFDTNQFEIE